MKRMKKTGHPLVLTVNCKAEAASTPQEVVGHPEAVTSIRGLIQARKGEGRLADEVFAELEHEDSAR